MNYKLKSSKINLETKHKKGDTFTTQYEIDNEKQPKIGRRNIENAVS